MEWLPSIMLMMRRSVLVLMLAIALLGSGTEDTDLRHIFMQMKTSVQGIQTLSYRLKNSERIKGKMLSGEQITHYSKIPRKIHIYSLNPNKGTEVLFVENENDGKAIVTMNNFLYPRLKLDPQGSILRSNNHHTLLESGFDYFAEIILVNYLSKPENFVLAGEVVWEGRPCYRVIMEIKDYRYNTYLASPKETTQAISRKFLINEYALVELNRMKGFGEVSENKVLSVPSNYARKAELYIDKENFLPIRQIIHDESGIFEMYEYLDVAINPKIPDSLFQFKSKGVMVPLALD